MENKQMQCHICMHYPYETKQEARLRYRHTYLETHIQNKAISY